MCIRDSYKGKSLYVTREFAVPLKKNEYYIADLIGMEVFLEDGTLFGELKDVMETGANDVYVIYTTEKKEVLVPAIKDLSLIHIYSLYNVLQEVYYGSQ